MSRKTARRLALAAAILAAIVWLFVNRDHLEMKALVAWVGGFGVLAPLIYIAARALGAVVLVPGSVMAIAAGMLFGPVWGAVHNLVASTLGAIFAFLVARYLASDFVTRKVGGRLKRIIEGIETEGWRFVAFVRLVPLFPYNLLNYALGLTRIRFSHYALASLVCMIPGDIAYVYVGFAGREALAGSENSIELGLLALGLLATIAFLPRLVRRYRRSQKIGDSI